MKRVQLVFISTILLGGAAITTPRDPARYQQAAEAVQAALSEGNYSTEVREFRRLLELHPNDPQIRAQFYLAMGSAAEARASRVVLVLGLAIRPVRPSGRDRGDRG